MLRNNPSSQGVEVELYGKAYDFKKSNGSKETEDEVMPQAALKPEKQFDQKGNVGKLVYQLVQSLAPSHDFESQRSQTP